MFAFAHVTDVHFGDGSHPGQGFPLQRPHDPVKCERLEVDLTYAFQDVLANDQPPVVGITGDLTVSGSDRQFATAQTYFRSRIFPTGKRRDSFGLELGDQQVVSIPGNHDHWNGNRTNTTPHNPGIFLAQFTQTPWAITWNDPGGQFSIDVFGIDSSSGWAANAGQYGRRGSGFLAHGLVSDVEFLRLEDLLKISAAKSERVARVIMCHHSLSYAGGGWMRTGILDTTSTVRLLALCSRYQVAAVLTGHTHDFNFQAFPAHATNPGWTVRELRSAATLCREPGCGFLMHSISTYGPHLRWEAIKYRWQLSSFVRTDPSWSFAF